MIHSFSDLIDYFDELIYQFHQQMQFYVTTRDFLTAILGNIVCIASLIHLSRVGLLLWQTGSSSAEERQKEKLSTLFQKISDLTQKYNEPFSALSLFATGNLVRASINSANPRTTINLNIFFSFSFLLTTKIY